MKLSEYIKVLIDLNSKTTNDIDVVVFNRSLGIYEDPSEKPNVLAIDDNGYRLDVGNQFVHESDSVVFCVG